MLGWLLRCRGIVSSRRAGTTESGPLGWGRRVEGSGTQFPAEMAPGRALRHFGNDTVPTIQNVCTVQIRRAGAFMVAWRSMCSQDVPLGDGGCQPKAFPGELLAAVMVKTPQGGMTGSLAELPPHGVADKSRRWPRSTVAGSHHDGSTPKPTSTRPRTSAWRTSGWSPPRCRHKRSTGRRLGKHRASDERAASRLLPTTEARPEMRRGRPEARSAMGSPSASRESGMSAPPTVYGVLSGGTASEATGWAGPVRRHGI